MEVSMSGLKGQPGLRRADDSANALVPGVQAHAGAQAWQPLPDPYDGWPELLLRLHDLAAGSAVSRHA